MDSLQWGAQPVGGDRDDRQGPAPGGQLKGDAGAEGVPGDVELGYTQPVQLAFDGVRQAAAVGATPGGSAGERPKPGRSKAMTS